MSVAAGTPAFESLLDALARACAIVAGLLVVAIALLTTGSILGRWLFATPLLGDTEIVEFGMAVVVAGCLPICQWRGDNIIVDFFTSRSSARARDQMDRFGALLVAVMMGVIAWRTGAGALDQKQSGTVTMLLQWPEWLAYALMTPPLALTATMGLYSAITGRNGAPAGPAIAVAASARP